MNEPALQPREWFDAQLGRAAAHLALLAPDDPFLRSRSAHLVGPDGDTGALSAEGERLARGLVTAPHPLAVLSRAYGLSPFETDLLLLAALPELDDRFADAVQAIQGGARRPTLALALRALLPADADREGVRQHLTGSALWRAQLLRADLSRAPYFDRPLEPVPMVSAGLIGSLPDALAEGARPRLSDPRADTRVRVAASLRPAAAAMSRALARWAELAGPGLVHLRGGDPAVARLVADALALELALPVLHIAPVRSEELLEAAAGAWLHGALLFVEPAPGTKDLRVPDAFRPPAPCVLAAPGSCELTLPDDLPSRRLATPRTRPIEQAATWTHWLHALGGDARVDLLANRTRLTVAEVERTVRLAGDRARLRGASCSEHADIAAALGEVFPEPVSSLASCTRPRIPWKRLVLDAWSLDQLEDISRRVEHRVTVQDRWGMVEDSHRGDGVAALLHGESGTGKTLAAEAIAARLDLPLLRVDLSRVVSKYIGETEKHLSGLFDMTEGFGSVLFFDEADALFGKRSGVKDAHDRYANIEINYLLQRLEAYEGITLLATNLLQNLDDAFTRRLHFIVPFPKPTRELQVRIWRAQLPAERLASDVSFARVVRKHELVGGDIRNAALAAAYAAAAAGTSVTQEQLLVAARHELIKRGRIS